MIIEVTPTSFDYDRVQQLHIELTNRCNAACPMCVRFHQNSPLIRPDLELGEISLEQFKSWFSPEFLRQINLILFCGVHGDPCIAHDALEIAKYILSSSPRTKVRFNTNAGMRNPEWWTELGNILSVSKENWVTFSIDGLEDTNHIYRRNVKWHKLMDNVKAFCKTGARAHWDYLIFKHNEHQIEQAEALAKELGFYEFIPKKALGVDDGSYLQPLPVLDKTGKLEYVIEAPVSQKNRNLENPLGNRDPDVYEFTLEDYKKTKETRDLPNYHKERYEDFYNKFDPFSKPQEDKCSISCKSFQSEGVELFIDNYGNVLPCCYVGTRIHGLYADDASLQLHHELKKYGLEKFNLNNHTLIEIMEARRLDDVFTNSWTKSKIASGKMLYCAEVCGKVSAVDKILTHEDAKKLKR